jgi:hypothetical protein
MLDSTVWLALVVVAHVVLMSNHAIELIAMLTK